MAIFPWRFQADIKKGETDPSVTVFLGAERAVLDDKGDPTADTFITPDTNDPVIVKLSELPNALANPDVLTMARTAAKAKTSLPSIEQKVS